MNAAMYIKTYFSVFYFVTEEGYRNSAVEAGPPPEVMMYSLLRLLS